MRYVHQPLQGESRRYVHQPLQGESTRNGILLRQRSHIFGQVIDNVYFFQVQQDKTRYTRYFIETIYYFQPTKLFMY
jgi:hypothetical protein